MEAAERHLVGEDEVTLLLEVVVLEAIGLEAAHLAAHHPQVLGVDVEHLGHVPPVEREDVQPLLLVQGERHALGGDEGHLAEHHGDQLLARQGHG